MYRSNQEDTAKNAPTVTDVVSSPTMNDLKLEIGQVQVCWSFLEAEMRKHLTKAGFDDRLKRGSVITHWREYIRGLAFIDGPEHVAEHLTQIDRLAAQRNLLVHGISSLSVDPYEGTAVVGCVDLDGNRQEFTISDLKELSAEIASMRLPLRAQFHLATAARR